MNANDKIVVTYQATVKANATSENMTNKASLTVGDETPDTPDVEEKVYSYQFTVHKKDQDGNKLDGAYFSVYKKGSTDAILLVNIGDGVYRRAVAGEGGAVDKFTTSDGTVVLQGFAEGEYYVKETDAPNGYVKTEEEFKIILIDEKGATNEDDDTIPDGALDEGSVASVTITNVKAEELPSTGGIGTTMFYMVGSVLATGALTLLVTKKRVEDEA